MAMRSVLRAFRMLRGHARSGARRQLICIGLLTLTAAGLAALAPLALKFLMDAASQSEGSLAGGGSGPEVWVLAYAGAMAAGRLVSEVRSLVFGAAEQALARGLARGALLHALRLPADYYSGRSTGEIQQVLENGIQGYRMLLQHALLTLGPGLFELVLMAAIILAWLDIVFLAVFGAFAAAYGAVFVVTARSVVRAARRVSAARIKANAWLADGLMNQETVRAGCGAETVTARFDVRLAATETAWGGLYRARLYAGFLAALVMALGLGAALLLSLAGIRAGERTIGDLVLVHAAMLQTVRPLEMLAGALRDAGQATAFAERLDALLGEAPEAAGGGEAFPPDRARLPVSVRFENVSFAHPGGQVVLDSVSFDIPAGAKAAIVGPSGSGKSTLLRLLLRFHEPQAGRILLNDVPYTDMAPDEVRRHIAAVLQDGGLFDASLAFNIAFPEDTADPGRLAELAQAAGLGPVLSGLPEGIAARIGERGMRLSGGERQRLVLARALGRRSGLLIADEPASALDPASRARIRDLLSGAARTRTVIVVSHILEDVCSADLILVMEAGRLVEQGTHTELLARGGLYARMWHARS